MSSLELQSQKILPFLVFAVAGVAGGVVSHRLTKDCVKLPIFFNVKINVLKIHLYRTERH